MDELNYDGLVQEALRGVVKKSLQVVASNGLSGNHHFYITFRTDHPRVKMPIGLKKGHPEEITIVLQYQFWELEVLDDAFEVTLSFDDVHHRLFVPLDAVIGFVDPSVNFGLQFTPVVSPEREGDNLLQEGGSSEEVGAVFDKDSNVIALDLFRKKKP